jgi:macrolide transport system ATP-binding/permease protein
MGWVRRLRRTFSGSEADFDGERRFHIDERTDEYVRNGLSREDARRLALKRFGNAMLVTEQTQDVDMFRWIHDVGRDTRYALRMLRRSPGFSLLAILCLTLGIGANAAVFSWIEGILLRPYPLVVDQDRLFALTGTDRGAPGNTDVSWPDWLDLQRNSTLVEAFIGEKITGTTLSVGDRAERAPGSMVSANYFDAIGVHPVLGRGFEAGEDSGRNAHPVTVISYQLWQNRFHGDPAIVGKTQVLRGLPHTIVGVTPKGFYGTFVGYAFQFWVPASMQSQFDAGVYKLEDRGAQWIEGYVRLKPGVTIEQAQAELSAIAARLEAAFPETNRGRGVRLFPLWQTPFNNAGGLLPTLGIALVVVFSVLLIACANVGNLLLVRAFARQQEMTIRLSLGAGRGRLVKQLMTEGLMLSIIAAAGGLVVANWLRDALGLLTPPRAGVPLRLPGDLDWRVLALSAGLCVVSTLLFALVPAMLTSNIDLAGALRSQSGGVVGAGRAWVRSALVLLQVSLSFVLLVGAGLLIQSLQAVRSASPGFSTRGVLTTGVDLFTAGYDVQRAKTFQNELVDRLQALGGVESVAFSRMTPFSYRDYSTAAIAVDGYEAPLDRQPTADYNEIGPAFLATMGIPLVAGREFTRADDETAPLVAVVDETMATQFWGGLDAVGRRVRVKGRWMQIVGVARNARYRNLLETPEPFFYVALRQNFSAATALQIRTTQGPAALAPSLVREIHALDANVAPSELITMREQVERTTAPQRISVTILVVFGGLAVVLAAIGLYGVMASTVSQSSRELALRMALGASARDLLGLVLSKGLALTAGGLGLGLIAALQVTRLLGYLLYQVSPRDPIAFVSAFGVVVVAAFVACFVPAWRATRTDPLGALRG